MFGRNFQSWGHNVGIDWILVSTPYTILTQRLSIMGTCQLVETSILVSTEKSLYKCYPVVSRERFELLSSSFLRLSCSSRTHMFHVFYAILACVVCILLVIAIAVVQCIRHLSPKNWMNWMGESFPRSSTVMALYQL